MQYNYLFLGLLCGIILGWLIGRLTAKAAALQQINKIEARLATEVQQRIMAETRLDEKTQAWELTNSALRESFDAAAALALKNNNQLFLDLAGQTMNNYLNQAKGDFGKRQEAIEQILKPFKESLDKHEQMSRNLESSTKETFGGLRNYLDQLKISQETLAKETNALVTALKSPRVRGRWGEIGLRRVVEFSGMSVYCDFTEQVSLNTEDGRLRPDMVVKLPEGRSVIVDSKVPLNAYLDAMEQEDEAARKTLLLKYAKDVRGHMNNLASKAYWAQFDKSVDFVVMYVEVESAFGAALSQDRDLILDGINSKVILATPTTLITLLRTIAYSWKQQEITENANSIWETGKELYERICIFAEHFSDAGKGLESAVKNYNSAVGSWEHRVAPSSRKLKELGASSGKKELPVLEEIDTGIRKLIDKE